jgi:hypothetical protein
VHPKTHSLPFPARETSNGKERKVERTKKETPLFEERKVDDRR